jgi:hypothetical protein
LPKPALSDLVNRDGVEVVQFLAAAPQRDDEPGVLENTEVLPNTLTQPTVGVGEGAECQVVIRGNFSIMQP